MNKFEYRGLKAKIEYSDEDALFVGRISDIDSLIVFSGESVSELRTEFQHAVDAYYTHCELAGVAPEKPCKGSFNIRIGPHLHRQAATFAKARNMALNEFVKEAVSSSVARHLEPGTHVNSVEGRARVYLRTVTATEFGTGWQEDEAAQQSFLGNIQPAILKSFAKAH